MKPTAAPPAPTSGYGWLQRTRKSHYWIPDKAGRLRTLCELFNVDASEVLWKQLPLEAPKFINLTCPDCEVRLAQGERAQQKQRAVMASMSLAKKAAAKSP